MYKRCLVFVLSALVASGALAQGKKRIERAADLPRFSYKVEGKLEDLVRDPQAFSRFADAVRRDDESVLAQYDIADKAAERGLLGVLARIDFLEGRYAEAGHRAEEIRALEEKPADKLLSGMTLLAMVAAEKKVGDVTSEAYKEEVARIVSAQLEQMPYAVIGNDIKEAKTGSEIIGETLVLGGIRERLQPVVDKAGGVLSSELAPSIIGARYALVARLPLKDTLARTYTAYLAAHKVEKPDIWAARDATLPAGKGYKPVNIAVWDSGVDTSLFPGRVRLDASGKPAFLAFDVRENPSTSPLMPIPEALRGRVAELKSRIKGLSDLQSNIDSPEASEVKTLLSKLKPDEYRAVVEQLGLAGNYIHGTHVAGIATAGNPYARLVNARIEFDYHLLPDPCPSRELADKNARNVQADVDFFKREGVRVVNMSWGGTVTDEERQLELCNIGKTPDERKKIAREYFDIQKNALVAAFKSAPGILFVAAAGNSNENSTFAEAVPADIVLPNVLTVGAVDKAGDEASFTSYGPTVKVHANGYQVESYLPGGDRVALSGTSMASPQVTGLAGKMLAVNPKLTPEQLIAIIEKTSETTADGRRHLIDPKKAVAAAGSA
ncbi:MAG TPA: S8 family serine peptidase [Usitatibacter sp.]|jgi:subtilisin family serine protease|nr:S8 family serine peptidase [Usitatibacter sp.]